MSRSIGIEANGPFSAALAAVAARRDDLAEPPQRAPPPRQPAAKPLSAQTAHRFPRAIPTTPSRPCRMNSSARSDRLIIAGPGEARTSSSTALLDLDVRTIVARVWRAGFLARTARNRFMSVDVRVGNYNLDSSNFITDEGFSGFLRLDGHGRHRPRLRFAAPGPLAGHRSGVQGRRRIISKKQAFLRAWRMRPASPIFPRSRRP